jgi:hypothetical protein
MIIGGILIIKQIVHLYTYNFELQLTMALNKLQ